jgi:hypothetical protein
VAGIAVRAARLAVLGPCVGRPHSGEGIAHRDSQHRPSLGVLRLRARVQQGRRVRLLRAA